METVSKQVEATPPKNIIPKIAEQTPKAPETNKVILSHLWERESSLATHAYVKCLDKIWRVTGKYSCEELVKTFTAENGAWNYLQAGKSSPDHGICQLSIRYHKKFINSDAFQDPHKQIDYCVEVRIDAKNKWSMPRYANSYYDNSGMYTARQLANRVKARSLVQFI